MSGDLLIPATPGLPDGWTGPVVYCFEAPSGRGTPGVWDEGDLYLKGYPVSDDTYDDGLCLDLARAEVRDRVVRVLAKHVGLGTTEGARWTHRSAREWELRGDEWRGMCAGSPAIDYAERRFTAGMSMGERRLAARRGREKLWVEVPALAVLDPRDGIRLPDGSRRVDAEALRAVWLEVARG